MFHCDNHSQVEQVDESKKPKLVDETPLELMKKWGNQAMKKTGAGVEKLVVKLMVKAKLYRKLKLIC